MAETSTLTLANLMEEAKPKKEYTGYVLSDDMVLAIDVSGDTPEKDFTKIVPDNFAVIEMGAKTVDSTLDAQEKDTNYIRSGKNTTKTGTQRTFSPKLDRYIGDAAQDYIDSLKYGTGQSVIVNYAYINRLNGMGEVGSVSVAVTSDGGGEGGDNAAFECSLKGISGKPVPYDWIANHPAQTAPAAGNSENGTGAEPANEDINSADKVSDPADENAEEA